MTKYTAFLIHLVVSLLIVAGVYLVIRFQIYPDFYFKIQGIAEIILILFLVDVILGPLLTFIVYKPGKKSLKFDLSVIAAFQLAALSYGTYTIYQERPLSALLVTNSFNIQTASSYDLSKVDINKIDTGLFSSPRFHVFVTEDPQIRIAMTVHSLTGEGSIDYLQDTAFYFGIDEQRERIEKTALSDAYLEKIYPDFDADTARYLFIQVIGKAGFGLVQIDKENLAVIDVVKLTDFDMKPL